MGKTQKEKFSKGITIVSLVVTIIVLIILAGVSINLILGENGIITIAKQSKQNIELAQEEEQMKLNELYTQIKLEDEIIDGTLYDVISEFKEFRKVIANVITSKGVETSENDSKETMAENIRKIGTDEKSVDTVENYKNTGVYATEQITIKDSSENLIKVPEGFKISENSGINITEGIVIKDKKENEFVWIPVNLAEGETFETKYPRTDFSANKPTGSVAATYTEPYTSGYGTEQEEYEEMLASINSNKGFYIGRFETGFNAEKAKETYTSYTSDPTQEQIEEETAKLVVTQGAQVYNYVPWGSAMNDITAVNKGTINAPLYVIGAVELAKNFDKVNNYSGVTSTLIYGIQWDMVLRYVSDARHNVNNSLIWGNYTNYSTVTGDTSTECGSLQTTGKNENWQAKKICDLAGNAFEWTMESSSEGNRISRGR